MLKNLLKNTLRWPKLSRCGEKLFFKVVSRISQIDALFAEPAFSSRPVVFSGCEQ